MFIIETYSSAVLLCIVTMLCWGSWANTQKLTSSSWRFELFYWDYAIGIVLASLILAFTLGSSGHWNRFSLRCGSELLSGSAGKSIVDFWRCCVDRDRHYFKCESV